MSKPLAELNKLEQAFILRHRIARMATADDNNRPHAIPICYAFDGHTLFTAIDSKPKRNPDRTLKRIKNIEHNPSVAIIIDDYSENWEQLAYLMIRGSADVISTGTDYHRALALLTEKYPQYQQMGLRQLALPVIRVVPTTIIAWGIE